MHMKKLTKRTLSMKRLLLFLLLAYGLRATDTAREKPAAEAASSYTIVIDPGHGGPYIGAASPSQSVSLKKMQYLSWLCFLLKG